MILVLVLGLVLTASAVTLLIRAVNVSRVRAAEMIEQIDWYGFAGEQGRASAESRRASGAIDDLAKSLGAFAARLRPFNEQKMRTELVAAGLYSLSPRTFLGYRVISTLAVSVLFIWLTIATAASPVFAFFGVVLVAVGGWILPMIFIQRLAARRLEQVDYKLPELIDLLIVTVEAGVGFTGSLTIAADRLGGPLGEELRLTLKEQDMGLMTNEALANLMERCGTPGMRAFVRSVIQGETLGVSIGQILRNIAVDMRKRRRSAAEERAQKAPIKLLFPLVFLIFPAIFVILLGPAMYGLLDALKG